MADFPYKYIESYTHDHRIGVLVEFGTETELTTRIPKVSSFMKDVALQIAAMDELAGQAESHDEFRRLLLTSLRTKQQ